MQDIAKEENKTFLKISRVPIHIKELFVEIAEENHTGDYGVLLQWCLEQALEYQRVKDVLLDKEFLTYILENKPMVETQIEKVENKPKRKTFSDKRIELQGGKK